MIGLGRCLDCGPVPLTRAGACSLWRGLNPSPVPAQGPAGLRPGRANPVDALSRNHAGRAGDSMKRTKTGVWFCARCGHARKGVSCEACRLSREDSARLDAEKLAKGGA